MLACLTSPHLAKKECNEVQNVLWCERRHRAEVMMKDKPNTSHFLSTFNLKIKLQMHLKFCCSTQHQEAYCQDSLLKPLSQKCKKSCISRGKGAFQQAKLFTIWQDSGLTQQTFCGWNFSLGLHRCFLYSPRELACFKWTTSISKISQIQCREYLDPA